MGTEEVCLMIDGFVGNERAIRAENLPHCVDFSGMANAVMCGKRCAIRNQCGFYQEARKVI